MGANHTAAVIARPVDHRDPPGRTITDWTNARRGKTAALSRAWATQKLDRQGQERPLPPRANPVHATNPEQTWPTREAAARDLGISTAELRNRLSHGRAVKGRILTRLAPARHGVATPVICLETRKTWPSAADAARALGVSRPHLCAAIRQGSRMHGRYYQWLQQPATIPPCATNNSPASPSPSPPSPQSAAAPQ